MSYLLVGEGGGRGTKLRKFSISVLKFLKIFIITNCDDLKITLALHSYLFQNGTLFPNIVLLNFSNFWVKFFFISDNSSTPFWQFQDALPSILANCADLSLFAVKRINFMMKFGKIQLSDITTYHAPLPNILENRAFFVVGWKKLKSFKFGNLNLLNQRLHFDFLF